MFCFQSTVNPPKLVENYDSVGLCQTNEYKGFVLLCCFTFDNFNFIYNQPFLAVYRPILLNTVFFHIRMGIFESDEKYSIWSPFSVIQIERSTMLFYALNFETYNIVWKMLYVISNSKFNFFVEFDSKLTRSYKCFNEFMPKIGFMVKDFVVHFKFIFSNKNKIIKTPLLCSTP